MWLTIQIAAGIVLAYIVIQNGAAIWRYSLWALVLVALAAGALAIGSYANEATASYGGLSGIISTVLGVAGLMLFGVIFMLALVLQGRWVIALFGRLLKTHWEPGAWGQFFVGLANFTLTGFALQGFDMADQGELMRTVEAYSRSLGLADSLTVVFWGLVSLWVVPLGKWLARPAENTEDADRGSSA